MSCGKLVILESLARDEAQTGTSLAEKMMLHGVEYPVHLRKVGNASEFQEAMKELSWQLVPGNGAALHVEMHGDANAGLVLAPSGDSVSWEEFGRLCREANQACSNNLLVTIAACHGQCALRAICNANALTPFCILVAPNSSAAVRDLVSFSDFYETLIGANDILRAHGQLPDQFALDYCEEILAKALVDYIIHGTMGKGRRLRVERLVTRIRKAKPRIPLRTARAHLKRHVVFSREHFERYRRSFLMADAPENRDRFRLSHKELVGFAEHRALRQRTRPQG